MIARLSPNQAGILFLLLILAGIVLFRLDTLPPERPRHHDRMQVGTQLPFGGTATSVIVGQYENPR